MDDFLCACCFRWCSKDSLVRIDNETEICESCSYKEVDE